MEHLDFVNKLNESGVQIRSTTAENREKIYEVSSLFDRIKVSVKNNKCEFVDYKSYTGSTALAYLIAKQIDRGEWKHSWHLNVYDSKNYDRLLEIMQKTMIAYASSIEEMMTTYFALRKEMIEQETREFESKGSANFNINQQPHGGQSVSQPAPNAEDGTSPC